MADVVAKLQRTGESRKRKVAAGGVDEKNETKRGTFRQRLQIRKEQIDLWEEKMELREQEMITQKMWIEAWLKKRQHIEDAVRKDGVEVGGSECFIKMEQDLKEMKTDMELEQGEILQELAEIQPSILHAIKRFILNCPK